MAPAVEPTVPVVEALGLRNEAVSSPAHPVPLVVSLPVLEPQPSDRLVHVSLPAAPELSLLLLLLLRLLPQPVAVAARPHRALAAAVVVAAPRPLPLATLRVGCA